MAIRFWLFARVFRGPDLRHDLIQVPALRGLKGRELLVALELLEPQQLADGQYVPVVDIARHRPGERTGELVRRRTNAHHLRMRLHCSFSLSIRFLLLPFDLPTFRSHVVDRSGYSFELPELWIACFCARICSITCCRLKEGGDCIGGNSSKLSRCRIAIPWPMGRMLKS